MPEAVNLRPGIAFDALTLRRRGNTFKALLDDTADLLETLKYASEEDSDAAKAQAAAIRQVLTDDK